MLVGLKGLLACTGILYTSIRVLSFKQRKHLTIFLLVDSDPILQVFSSSAICIAIKLFQVNPKVFENHKPIKPQEFFPFIPPLPTPLPSSYPHAAAMLFFLLQ